MTEVRLDLEELRELGLTEAQVRNLVVDGRLEPAFGGDLVIGSALLVFNLVSWLVAGLVSTWVFVNVLDLAGLAPWD